MSAGLPSGVSIKVSGMMRRGDCLLARWRGGHGRQLTGLLLLFASHVVLLTTSCSEAQEHMAPAVNPEDSASMMTSYGVNTLISDSGVIKYRIVTERWDVNTVRQPSRWEFMKGIFFEQFDEQFHVQAYIQADTAWYFDKQRVARSARRRSRSAVPVLPTDCRLRCQRPRTSLWSSSRGSGSSARRCGSRSPQECAQG